MQGRVTRGQAEPSNQTITHIFELVNRQRFVGASRGVTFGHRPGPRAPGVWRSPQATPWRLGEIRDMDLTPVHAIRLPRGRYRALLSFAASDQAFAASALFPCAL